MKKINIRGIDFDNVTCEEAVSLILERLENGEESVVFTPNSEIVENCIEDSDFSKIISSAQVILPDGIGVIKASKILGEPLKEKVAGVEVGEKLLSRLKERKVFFLGGEKNSSSGTSVAEAAKQVLAGKYDCNIVGTMHGYFKKEGEENDEVIDMINSSCAEVLYVCLGSPMQEKWIYSNKSRLPHVKLFLALGGSFDVYAGKTKRAPKIFIDLGLEWFWRLLKEPSRIGRMIKLPKFYFGTIIYKIKRGKHN